MATSKINTPTKLERLKPRNEPYWEKLSTGRFLGYYRGAGDSGAWIARLDGKRIEVNGKSTIPRRREKVATNEIDYEQALKLAVAWCDAEDRGSNAKYTLEACISDYCKKLALEKNARTAKHSKSRLHGHLEPAMLEMDVKKITTREFNDWHKSMVKTGDPETVRKSKDSANRTWSMLRAALNNAYKLGILDSDREWSRVQSFKAVSTARKLFLSDEQVNDLLQNAEPHLQALCKAAVLTGARYSEIANAQVKDLENGILRLSGKTGERDVHLSAAAESFFKDQAKSKTPAAPLLSARDGKHWARCAQTRPMKAAVAAAKLPRETVFYSLRHYHISKAVGAGVSMLAIAKNCGTSVKMIQDHYGKFSPKDMRDLMNMVELAGG